VVGFNKKKVGDPPEPKAPRPDDFAIWHLGGLFVIAILVLLVGLLLAASPLGGGYLSIIGLGILVADGGFVAGAALGFIFALPNVAPRSSEPAAGGAAPPTGAATPAASAPASRPGGVVTRYLSTNTNLSRVSDWLATIVVGLSLVQLHKVNSYLVQFRDFLSADACTATAAHLACGAAIGKIGPIVLVFAVISGFLVMYLYTRVLLTPVLADVESQLSQPLDAVSNSSVLAALGGTTTGQAGFVSRVLKPGAARLSVQDTIRLMRDSLYQPPPGGFEQTIALGTALTGTAALESAEYWFYLTAAFGQQYTHLLNHQAGEDQLLSAKFNALDCARRAIERDPRFKLNIANLMLDREPDNDLKDLAGEREFQDLVR